MILERRNARSLTLSLLLSACGADGGGPAPLPKPPESSQTIRLKLVADQLSPLRHLDPVCAKMLAPNFAGKGIVSAIGIDGSGANRCSFSDEEAAAVTENGTLWHRDSAGSSVGLTVIPLRKYKANLLRIESNGGGSLSLVTYLVVHVMSDGGRKHVLVRSVLPASIASDAAAVTYAEKIF